MTDRPHVLISGASIAGPALAFWLNRYGWSTTIVERAPQLRTGGQNVDIRGAAREVLRRAGLEDAVRAANTGEVGTRFLGRDGAVVAEFPVRASQTGGATAELEILRGDLARIFVDAGATDTEYVFGDRIVGLEDTGDEIAVTFAGGSERRVDLVIAADGMRSSTRRLALDEETRVRPLGMEMTYLTIPRTRSDTNWWNWYSEPGGLAVTLRPDRHGTTRAVLSSIVYDGDPNDRRLSDEEQIEHLRRQFGHVGWQAPRVLDALSAADDMYFETIGQVRASRWSRGRFALTGDAAWCASPVSGMGTSLAIVGAYVLAGELAAHVDHRDAFAGYERVMRPYVDQAQQLPPGVPRVANPKSRVGLAAFHTAMRLAATPLIGKLGGRLFTPPSDRIELPDYAHLQRAGR